MIEDRQIRMIVGQRLRTLRKQQKITAEELGSYLGVSGQQVLRYETNQNDMTTDNLVKIANFFDVSADYLLGRADSQVPYQRKGMLSWTVDATGLLRHFSPERVGRFIKSLGFIVRIKELEESGKKAMWIEIPEKPEKT